MIKKLSKHGNSWAILIDKPILELLNANENTQFKIRIDNNNLILEPVHKESKAGKVSDDPKLQSIYEELVEKYDNLLKKLADS